MNYDIQNPQTGETLTVDFPNPPTQEQVQDYLKSQNKVVSGVTFQQEQPKKTLIEREGGAERALSPEEALNVAVKRAARRAQEAGQSHVEMTPEGNVRILGRSPAEQVAAFLRPMASVRTFGLSEPLLAAISPKRGMDVLQAATEENPVTDVLGNVAGLISGGISPGVIKKLGIPILEKLGSPVLKSIAGETLPETASLGSKILQVAKGAGKASAGAGLFGGAEELGREIREEEPISSGKVLTSAIQTAVDPKIAALGALAAGYRLKAKPQSVKQAQQIEGSNNLMADILKPSGMIDKENFIESVNSGDLHNTVRLIASQQKPKNLVEFVEAGQKTADEYLKPAIESLKNVDPKARIDNAPLLQGAIEEAKKYPLGGVGDKIINYVNEEFKEPMSLKDAITKQIQLNKEYRETIKSEGISDPAKEFARRELSKMIDNEFQRLTGTEENPYREYGKVEEVNDMLLKSLLKLSTENMVARGKGWFERLKEGISHPSKHGVLKGVAESFYTGDIGRINKQVERLFNRPDVTPRELVSVPFSIPVEEATTQVESVKPKKFSIRRKPDEANQ